MTKLKDALKDSKTVIAFGCAWGSAKTGRKLKDFISDCEVSEKDLSFDGFWEDIRNTDGDKLTIFKFTEGYLVKK